MRIREVSGHLIKYILTEGTYSVWDGNTKVREFSSLEEAEAWCNNNPKEN